MIPFEAGKCPIQPPPRELDGIASAHIEELSAALPGFAEAMAWPG